MQPAVRPRTILLPRRALLLFIAFLFAAFLTLPAVAEYLGPDRTTTVFVEVRDPDHDVWTLTHVDPFDGLADVCLVIHTCKEHPSVERQQALCGWVADNSGCDEAFKTEEQTVLLPEATISGGLQNCSLVDGWCTTSPTLHLTANEPVAGEAITLIEGSRNGEPFACAGVVCEVALLEGSNDFTFWALSTWGDSSQMGTLSALVDSLGPTLALPDGWYIWEPLAIGVEDGQIGVDRVKLTIDGGNFGNRVYEWTLGNLPSDFIWDRHFGEVIAPIGEYPVSVKAWDMLGNSTSAAGLILIPPPEVPESAEEFSEPVSGPAPTEAPEPTATPIASGLGVEPTSTSEPLGALVGEPATSIGSAEPATTTTSAEGGSGTLLWGAAALGAAASAMAYALNRRRAREAEVEKMRREAGKSASPGAFAQRLSSLRARAEAVVAPIRNSMIIAAAATQAALELARQRAEEARHQRAEQLRAEREERAEQAERRATLEPPRTAAEGTPEVDAWQRIELQRAQQYAGYSSPPRPNLLQDPMGFISHYSDLARDALKGYAIFNLVQAAREISITEVTTTLRIRGPLSARSTLGFRERVNWLRPENIERLAQSPALRAVRSLRSWGVVFGLGGNLATDTADFLEGDYDRQEYASALTIDTGITIAAALIGGAIAGWLTGVLIGAGLGTFSIPIPIVGTIAGAAIAGVIGGIVGIAAAGAAVSGLEASGIRGFLVDNVANLYRSWTETTP